MADEQQTAQEEREEFWSGIVIPINENWQQDNTNFANPVDVADMFARATGTSTMLASEAEGLTEEIANFEFERDEAQIDLTKIRRQILADNFTDIKASWSGDVIEAFILSKAGDQKERMLELEQHIEESVRQVRLRKPRLTKLEKRLKSLEKHMDWAKQWLDYDKLLQRITQVGKRI